MNINDIIALAKQGYKPGDIKELIALAETPKATPQDEAQTAPAEEPLKTENEPEPQNSEPAEPVIDYKALYEDSQKKLAEAQKVNTQKTISAPEKESDMDIIMKWAQS